MAADSRMEDIQALIPNVGNDEGRQCGRDHTTRICGGETPAYERVKNLIRTERERERGTKRYLLLTRMQQLQMTTFT